MEYEPFVPMEMICGGLEDLLAPEPKDADVLKAAMIAILTEAALAPDSLTSPLYKEAVAAMKTLKFKVTEHRNIILDPAPRFAKALILVERGTELFRAVPDLRVRLLHEKL